MPTRNQPALVDAIARAIAEPNATQTRATAARRRVEQELSFSKRLERLESIYEELATRLPARHSFTSLEGYISQ